MSAGAPKSNDPDWFESGPIEQWTLPSDWAIHLLTEARRRGLAIQGLQRDSNGLLLEVAPEALIHGAQSPTPITRIRQHLSSSGLCTTVSFCTEDETHGIWFSPRERDRHEEPAWRLLLLETLVLASGRRPMGSPRRQRAALRPVD